MTEIEKMEKGLIYDPNIDEIAKVQRPLLDGLKKFNSLNTSDIKGKEK